MSMNGCDQIYFEKDKNISEVKLVISIWKY